jgi:succinyl-diaminopimelate desuccinylase
MRASITPEDAGCQLILTQRLEALGFQAEHLPFGEVTNLWARRGDDRPVFVFAGHTDVVPTGPVEDWLAPPFAANIENGFLYGRGAADMKGSLAAMITACEAFLFNHPQPVGSIAFLITSDEEGPAQNGTAKVIEHLLARGDHIDYCLVGEPSSSECLGDVIKIGRRGSMTGHLRVLGKQGHVAYPHLADNPIHRCAAPLAELSTLEWDRGNQHFPPTSFQVTSIRSGTGATNVVPGHTDIQFNLRFSSELRDVDIREQVEATLDNYGLSYELDWVVFGQPFLTGPGELIDGACRAVERVSGTRPQLSTSGGTSDGRFIAPTGAQVVELGPVNATIHKINEQVSVADLGTLSRIYEQVLIELMASS